MKKIVSLSLLVAVAVMANAQPGTTPAKTAIVAKPVGNPLKNINDSASYAVGLSVANFYKQQGITNLNTALISKAINDVFKSQKLLFDDQEANACMNKYMTKISQKKSQPAIDTGMAFLTKNQKRPGVITTASGLQYEVITQGTGPKPTAADSVTCHYRGTLINGTVFDESYKNNAPITFNIRQVIPGWIEALQLMPVGSKYKLYVPYTLAYGAYDYGPIPGGSTLIFDIELLDIKKGEQIAAPPSGN